MALTSKHKYDRRKSRIRHKLGSQRHNLPRLNVFKSNKNTHAQLVNIETGEVIASASTVEPNLKKSLKNCSNNDAAKSVGQLIAKRAKDKKIDKVVFDRSGYVYHGRVKSLADAAREEGLNF